MDPVSAIAEGVGLIFNFFTVSKQSKYGRLPKWLTPTGDKDNRSKILIISGSVILLVVILAIVFTITRKK